MMSEFNSINGAWRGERIRRGLGLRETARRAGIAAGYLADIESGRRCPRPGICVRIEAALANDESDLLAFAGGSPDVLAILRLLRDGSARWGRDRVVGDVLRAAVRWRVR
jgi:transcriptional regulator with XRE-family HTH domain